MSYIEERIKFLAVKAWQDDRTKDVYKALNCPNKDCDDYEWGGTVRAEMRWPSAAREITTGQICVLMCDDCGHEFFTVLDQVIDSFLARI